MNAVETVPRRAVAEAWGARLADLLPPKEQLDVFECSAGDLLVPQRLDLAVKADYVAARLAKTDAPFPRTAYLEHIRAFNGFVEADDSGKVGPDGFCRAFDELIDSVCARGLEEDCLLPVSQDGVLLDGAHRAAVCLELGLPVRVVRTNLAAGPAFTAAYFGNRGLADTYVDAAVAGYVRRKPTTRMVLVWPTAENRDDELSSVVERHSRVVCRKDLHLTPAGSVNFVARAYRHEPWLGDASDDFAGARNKARWCFQGKGPLRLFVVEASDDLIACKDEIRGIFGSGKHSVHINDTHVETVELARLAFNANSLHWLNHADPTPPKWFARLFEHYDRWLDDVAADDGDFYCLDGSAVLGAYGVRDVRDLDYLYVGDDPVDSGFKEIAVHNGAARHYSRSLDGIVLDPTGHFWYQNRKMVALPVLREMKLARGEAKDLEDLHLVDTRLSGGRASLPVSTRLRRAVQPARVKGRLKMVALKGRYHLTRLRHRYGQL